MKLLDNNSGQTLLEAIIAIAIITTGIVSALSLSRASLAAETAGLNSVIAGNLAREGIEVVRSIRDSNWLAGRAWDVGLSGGASGVDYTAVAVLEPDNGIWNLDFDPDTINDSNAVIYRQTTEDGSAALGLYRQGTTAPDGSVPIGFWRLISLDPICRDAGGSQTIITTGVCPVEKIGTRVTVRVEWGGQSGDRRGLSVEERLYDWR